MKKLSKILFGFSSALLVFSATSYADYTHPRHPTTFLGPTLRLGFTSPLADVSAYSIAGEAGVKNFRLDGTLGFRLAQNQNVKFTAEYLWQKITYGFATGNSDQWMGQGALSGDYEYDLLGYRYNPALDINGYLSHINSKDVSHRMGAFVNSLGLKTFFIENRRIAGSNAGGVSPGVTVQPWQGGKLGLWLNYDNVRYNLKHSDHADDIGLGGTFKINQYIDDDVILGLGAGVRKPLNNYEANLAWTNVPFFGRWTVALGAEYTRGKDRMPNTYNIGFSADYFLDPLCPSTKPMSLKGDYKAEATRAVPVADNFLDWTAVPAVHMPQALAVTDRHLRDLDLI